MVEQEQAITAITGQYQDACGVADELFKLIGTKINSELWRLPGPSNNVGSCRYMIREASERGIEGIARDHIIELRDLRNSQTPGQAELTQCPYHRTESGCVLGDLKNPLCASYIDTPSELEVAGIDPKKLSGSIDFTLQIVLSAQNMQDVASNEAQVEGYKRYIEGIAKRVSSMPARVIL